MREALASSSSLVGGGCPLQAGADGKRCNHGTGFLVSVGRRRFCTSRSLVVAFIIRSKRNIITIVRNKTRGVPRVP